MSIAGLFGHYRISHEGRLQFDVDTATYDIPPDEDGLRRQQLGSDMPKLSGSWWGTQEFLELLGVRESRLVFPAAVYTRGESPGVVEMALKTQLATVTDQHQPDQVNQRELTFVINEAGRLVRAGVVFDYFTAHKTGVSAPVDGPAVNLGALLAAEELNFLYSSPNHPSPTTSNAVAKLQSATDAAFTTDVTDEVIFAAVNNTASHQLVTLAGPNPRPYYRLSVTTVTDGEYFPVLLAA